MSKSPTFADQGPQFRVLAQMAEAFPTMPRVHLGCYTHITDHLDFMVRSAADFERWRTALGIPSDDVVLSEARPADPSRYLRFRSQFNGLGLEFSVALPVPELEGVEA
ncbi:hypothetical protein HY68_01255 [Streptomyces sp. AcH 505]|uniref:hypothetical protein n=1 Tax=Streptomyces sp. AcH 505 TaxID=352211 RepID=UPI000591E4A5|nr:hypothetical protein HY68_01255 [Streptomyces sp. AcH 505]